MPDVEDLKERLVYMQNSVDELSDAVFKGNGHSLVSRVLVIEREGAEVKEDLDHVRASLHDLRNQATVVTLQSGQNDISLKALGLKIEKMQDGSTSKWWDFVKIVLTLVIGALFWGMVSSLQPKPPPVIQQQRIESH